MSSSRPSKLTVKHRKRKPTESRNPLDISRLLDDEEEKINVFMEYFVQRSMLPAKYGFLSSFKVGAFDFPLLLEEQGLDLMCIDNTAYYPDLVKVFYCNLKVDDGVLISKVMGKDIRLNASAFGRCCHGLPSEGLKLGDSVPCPWPDYDKKDYYVSLCRPSKLAGLLQKLELREIDKSKGTMTVGILTPEDRLLHYFLTYVIVPKHSNHAQINELELQLMYAMKHHIKVNWVYVIMNHMAKARTFHTPLPYARLLTRVFEACGIPLDGELCLMGTDDDCINKQEPKEGPTLIYSYYSHLISLLLVCLDRFS